VVLEFRMGKVFPLGMWFLKSESVSHLKEILSPGVLFLKFSLSLPPTVEGSPSGMLFLSSVSGPYLDFVFEFRILDSVFGFLNLHRAPPLAMGGSLLRM
jgi:hypothetical protein